MNRSLASMIGVPPAELIGVNMRALMALTSDSPPPTPAPSAAPWRRSPTNLFIPSSTAPTWFPLRAFMAPGEGLQTIHVLKDISDRREAERRYRELFDNIQEGLFFSTPGGRFVEVNDAMVRMLGYGSREELLQIDIPTQLYFSPEQREHHCPS